MTDSIDTNLAALTHVSKKKKESINIIVVKHNTQIQNLQDKIRRIEKRIEDIRTKLWMNWPSDRDRKEYSDELTRRTIVLQQQKDELLNKIKTEEEHKNYLKRTEDAVNEILKNAMSAIKKA